MLNETLVSIIMPAYNAEKYIGESIASVIKQTYTDWELIIIDDESADSTAAIAAEFVNNDPRIKYFYQERGRQGKARNLGINNSTGSYIAFLDADDIWCDNKLALQIEILKKRPDIDLICSQGYWLNEDGSILPFYTTIKEWNWANDSETFINVNQVAILSAVVKKSAIINAGLFTEKLSIQNTEDYHLWLKLLQKGYRFLSISDLLFYYRVHQSQSTYNRNEATKLLNCYIDLVETKVISNNSMALKNRLKWMIFQNEDLNYLFEKLKSIFPEKKWLFNLFISLNKLIPNKMLLKKAAFHSL
jgi:teichuronic acid biosynthesis glycosyltransferase TuaG